jgi:hypothetical protein
MRFFQTHKNNGGDRTGETYGIIFNIWIFNQFRTDLCAFEVVLERGVAEFCG